MNFDDMQANDASWITFLLGIVLLNIFSFVLGFIIGFGV